MECSRTRTEEGEHFEVRGGRGGWVGHPRLAVGAVRVAVVGRLDEQRQERRLQLPTVRAVRLAVQAAGVVAEFPEKQRVVDLKAHGSHIQQR